MKKLLEKAKAWISRLWGSIKPDAEKALTIGMKITDVVKTAVESPVADIMTALIPGDVDDRIKDVLRAAAPKVLISFGLVKDCSHETDPALIIQCASKTLAQIKNDFMGDSVYGNLCDSLAVTFAEIAADKKVSWDDLKYVSKWFFDNVYNKK